MFPRFHNRIETGRSLAMRLNHYANRPDALVLALPRGGVPVAFEIAQTLNLLLDVFVVRKLGIPGQEELAMGAIAAGGIRVLNEDVIAAAGIPQFLIDAVAAQEQQELARRERVYRGDRPSPVLQNRVIILVDDGLATGATMQAAIAAVRQQKPARVVVAVATIARESLDTLQIVADEIVYIIAPQPFYAVGIWYEDFTAPTDAEVCELLAQATVVPHAP